MLLVQRCRHRISAGSTLGLAVVVGLIAGCSAAPAASTPAATDEPVTSASASEAPADSPSESPSATSSASPSAAATIAADADLATLLPTTLGDAPVSIARFDGEDLTEVPRPEAQTSDQDPIGFGMGNGGIAALAEELDVLPAEVQGAMAYAPDHEPDFYPHAVIAVRVTGADPAAMVDALAIAIGGFQFLSGELTVTEETVGGKTVSVIESSNLNYFYAIGDVAFIVKIDDPDEAETVLQDLP